ncbi:MAG: YlbF family regulator [Culicoidibacterales bacterium]
MNKQITNEVILKAWQEFVETLVELPEVGAFKQAEQKITNHEQIYHLREQIKLEQKAMVNAKHYAKLEAVVVHQQTIDQYEAELSDIPLWHQYQDLKDHVNELVQEIIYEIETEI